MSLRGGMAQQREKFCCSICQDLLNDPVTTPCGHNYCRNCIQSHWDVEVAKKVYSCPQCRRVFRPRPLLGKNTMLADLVEDLRKTGFEDAFEAEKKQKDLEVSQRNIQKRVQEREKDVKLLQKEVEAINRSADRAVEHTEKIFTELARLMEKRCSDVKQQVRSQQKTEVGRVRELQEKLEQEITELKRLSHTEDYNQDHPSLSAISESTHLTFTENPNPRYFEDVTTVVTEVRDKLQDVLREKWKHVSKSVADVDALLSQPEPKTRDEFLKYSQAITLDPNTANKLLLLSEGDRKATVMDEQQPYSSHPDRFTDYPQVLSSQSLTGRCYWEVEWRGIGGVSVAVSYKDICRVGTLNECLFGHNEKSWMLDCDDTRYEFCHNSFPSPVSGPQSSRVGVYLDHSAGILSFYSVSDTMTLLHRVQTTFTQPLHAGLYLYYFSDGDTAEFCKLK